MTKEIYISSTPHETRLAVVEDDQLAEIYYERENEYTLAGSVYKGRVTRVLPGMQSAFVDVGLERDAFLYVTDFAEEQEDGDEYVSLPQGNGGGRANKDAFGGRSADPAAASTGQGAVNENGGRPSEEESGEQPSSGTRRWRGRRGRRRGRGGSRHESSAQTPDNAESSSFNQDEAESPLSIEPITETEFPESQTSPEHENRAREHAEPSAESSSPSSDRVIQLPLERRHGHGETHSPSVLPGESISKYRRGSSPFASPEQAAHGETPAASKGSREDAAKPPAPAFHPSTMVVAPLKWDGGNLLPGESISRYKKVQTSHTPSEETAANATALESGPEAPSAETSVVDAGSHNSEEPEPEPQPEPAAVSSGEGVDSETNEHLNDEESSTPLEEEPSSASYRFDPSGPSAYRQSGVMEPVETADMERSGFEASNEAAPEETTTEPETPSTDHNEAARAASPSSDLSRQEEDASAAFESESTDEPAADAGVPVANPAESRYRVFNPGEGQLEEETIDEEDTDQVPIETRAADEEYDDLIEETIESQLDSGLIGDVVRDRHIDRRTGFARDPLNGDANEESGAEIVESASEGDISEDSVDFDHDEPADSLSEESEPNETDASDVERSSVPRGRYGRGSRNQRMGRGGDRRRMRRATAQTSNLPAITELLKPNQEILVQIAKEPIARKGARITSHIALPGRFLVFMPTVNHVGVSRKITSDEQRQRLKRILLSEKGDTPGGFIVRTAAAAADEDDLRADIRFLLTLWSEIRQRAENSKPPALIYHDLSLIERVLRDRVTEQFSAVWVDNEQDYERILRFLNRFEPALVRRVKLYTKETPLFEQFGIQEEINKALRSKVWLKSGGSIVINQTEALVAIDINTGKYVGKTARLEDTILKTNLDAIPEIVRQIRLRDLGGIIVIDFIDMDERKNRNKVMQALEEALRSDRAPSKVLQFNDFGLVAITRKRVRQSLERTLSVPCFTCGGTGMVKGPVTVCNEIYVELRKMSRQIDRGDILLRVNPEVVKQLKASNGRWLSDMEELSGKTIIVKSDATLPPEQFDIH